MSFIYLKGSMLTGFTAIGPYETIDDAVDAADTDAEVETVIELQTKSVAEEAEETEHADLVCAECDYVLNDVAREIDHGVDNYVTFTSMPFDCENAEKGEFARICLACYTKKSQVPA